LSKYAIFLKNDQNTACKTTIWFHLKLKDLLHDFPDTPKGTTFPPSIRDEEVLK
jgi:hypothetical protein